MRDGQCKGSITFNQYWHQYLNKKVVNAVEGTPRCQIVSPAGSRILFGEGGFAVKADAGGKDGRCSSLVREVCALLVLVSSTLREGFEPFCVEYFPPLLKQSAVTIQIIREAYFLPNIVCFIK